MTEKYESSKLWLVEVLRPRKWAVVMSVLGTGVGLASMIFGPIVAMWFDWASLVGFMILGWNVFALGAIGLWHFLFNNRVSSGHCDELRCSKDHVFIGNARVIDRSSLVSGRVRPSTKLGTIVRLEPKSRFALPIEVRVGGIDEGRALLETLGFDVLHQTEEFCVDASSIKSRWQYLFSIWASLPLLGIFALVFLGHWLHAFTPFSWAFGLFTVVASFGCILAQRLTPAKAVVGADGVLVRWLWLKRFVPLDDIERVEVVRRRSILVRLHKKLGPPMDILIGEKRPNEFNAGPGLDARAEELCERIREALTAKRHRDEGLFVAENTLAQRSVSIADWIAELRGLVDRVETFRTGAGPLAPQLWRIVENTSAKPQMRAAAVVALTPQVDSETLVRLNAIAQVTASPKFRVVLEVAVSGNDEALATALDDLSREEVSNVL